MQAFLDGAEVGRETLFIIDPSATSFHAAMRRGGLKVRSARNAVADGIREVAACMQAGVIKVSETCKETIKEFAGYCWDERAAGDKPVKENDHLMDALRYGVATMRMYKPKQAAGKSRLRRLAEK